MALEFGNIPERGTLALSRYGDFVTEIISDDGAWPDEAELEFRFYPEGSSVVTWAATVDGDTALWNVDKAQVASVLDTGVGVYRLFYISGSYDLELSKGQIKNVT